MHVRHGRDGHEHGTREVEERMEAALEVARRRVVLQHQVLEVEAAARCLKVAQARLDGVHEAVQLHLRQAVLRL